MSDQKNYFTDNLAIYQTLCQGFNALLPKSELFRKIPPELIEGNHLSVKDFVTPPEIPIGPDEVLLDDMNCFEKNIHTVKSIIYENIMLFAQIGNASFKEKLDDSNLIDRIELKTNVNFFEVLKQIYTTIGIILLSSIMNRFDKKHIPVNGDIGIRQGYVIVQMPEKENTRTNPVFLMVPINNEDDCEENPGYCNDPNIPIQ